MIKKFRKKPVVIEAVKWTGLQSDLDKMISWFGVYRSLKNPSGKYESISWDKLKSEINIETLEGTMIASKGDWIIKGVEGELYPCKPAIFEKTYEEVND